MQQYIRVPIISDTLPIWHPLQSVRKKKIVLIPGVRDTLRYDTDDTNKYRSHFWVYRIVSYRVSFRIVFASSRIVFVSFLTCVHRVRLRI